MFSVDLAELPSLSSKVRFLGHNKRNLYSFFDVDHLSPENRPLRTKLEEFLNSEGVSLPSGARIQLITLPRVFGYIFNPVSFFFCYEPNGQPFCAVVEVGNTFREMKLFTIPSVSQYDDFRLRTPKEFYVSPFSTLDTHFDFRLSLPSDRLRILIDDYEKGELTLVSSLSGTRSELTTRQLAGLTLVYPFITLWVIFLIHWQALFLWLKGTPFIRKTDQPEMQKHVLRPHSSLKSKS